MSSFPVARAKPAFVKLSRSACIPIYLDLFGVRQIPEGEWWAGMWEFPRTALGKDCKVLGEIRHTVTHHRITLSVKVSNCEQAHPELRWMARSDLEALPMPAPQRRALELYEKFKG